MRADLEAHRPPRGRSMAVPTTPHIGWPYMLCAPGRSRGPGEGRPVAVPWVGRGGGREGGGGRVTVASADGRLVPAHLGQGA